MEELELYKDIFTNQTGNVEFYAPQLLRMVKAIEAQQQEIERLKNWNACEDKLHNELLESEKRLTQQVARMYEALEKIVSEIEWVIPCEGTDFETEHCKNVLVIAENALSNAPADYHNPVDLEKLKEHYSDGYTRVSDVNERLFEVVQLAKEALTLANEAISTCPYCRHSAGIHNVTNALSAIERIGGGNIE